MSLQILLIMVVAGVSMVGFAVHLSGGSRDAALAGADAAKARFAEDFPDDLVEQVFMAAKGEGAVLQLSDGAIGIVHNFGDRFVTRRLAAGSAIDLRDDGPQGFALLLREHAWPQVHFRFDDEGAMRQALAACGAASGKLEGAG